MNQVDPLNAIASAMHDAMRSFGLDRIDSILEIILFQQSWANTSCGFGGVAGQAITRADTVVIRHGNYARVYINRRYAYTAHVDGQFSIDLAERCLAGAAYADKTYKLLED
jgi:hypothetical protein